MNPVTGRKECHALSQIRQLISPRRCDRSIRCLQSTPTLMPRLPPRRWYPFATFRRPISRGRRPCRPWHPHRSTWRAANSSLCLVPAAAARARAVDDDRRTRRADRRVHLARRDRGEEAPSRHRRHFPGCYAVALEERARKRAVSGSHSQITDGGVSPARARAVGTWWGLSGFPKHKKPKSERLSQAECRQRGDLPGADPWSPEHPVDGRAVQRPRRHHARTR